jgi:anaerobic dimethyl sulfoxide reductase subunit A
VAHAYVLTPTAQYSDIVLPACTNWESYMPFVTTFINRELVIFPSPVTKPLYECKPNQQIIKEMSAYFGYNPDELFPYDEKQQFFDVIAGSKVLDEDGKTWMPLATITQEDVDEWGVDNPPQQGKIGFKDLVEQGFYHVKRHEGDNYGFIGYKEFREDPEAHPRPYSASGKLEICCQKKADSLNMINKLGFSQDVFRPYPTYHTPNNGYEQSFSDWQDKVKGEFPFQLFQPHYLRRAHTTFDNLPWLREAFANPVFLNSSDAKAKGIQDGDTVLIHNQWGKVLRHASLTDTLMPGCVGLPHGPWPDFDEETGIDLGGNENVLLGPVTGAYPVAGYNTCLVDIKKYDGPAIPPDRLKPRKIVNLD